MDVHVLRGSLCVEALVCYGVQKFHSLTRAQHPHVSFSQLVSSSCVSGTVHQVVVHEVPGQELEVEVYDKDTDKDDFLGRYI